MKKTLAAFTAVLFAILFTLFSCKKGSVERPIINPISKKIDYSKYQFGEIASASGSSISDTIWDSEREKIIGFKLQKKASSDFQYPIEGYETMPLINSFVSLKDLPNFHLKDYLSQSNTIVPRLLITTYEPKFYLDNIKIGSWKQMDSIVENRITQLKQDRTGTRDFIFDFYNYENLKLLFGEDVDIEKLFNITTADYPSLKNKGSLFYNERPTVSLRALFENKDFTDYFSDQQLRDRNIARVDRVKYGKIGYMVLDASENVKSLISKTSASNGKSQLTSKEINLINESKVYFYLRGYKPSDLDKITQATSTLDKVLEFRKLTEEKTFDRTEIGVPLFFTLKPHSSTLDIFNSAYYNRQINFIQ